MCVALRVEWATQGSISPLSGPESTTDKIFNQCLIFRLQRGRPVGKLTIPALEEGK
jgi:hypothetical protein